MRSRVFRIAIILLVALAVVLVVAAKWICGAPRYTTLWQAGDGAVAPAQFDYLLFPKSSHVELLNSNGTSAGKYLSRAMVCSQAELQNKFVGVFVGKDELKVPVDSLVFTLDATNRDLLVAEWKRTVKSWGRDTDWQFVDVAFEEIDSKSVRVELRMPDERHREAVYVYSIRDGAVIPEAVRASLPF